MATQYGGPNSSGRGAYAPPATSGLDMWSMRDPVASGNYAAGDRPGDHAIFGGTTRPTGKAAHPIAVASEPQAYIGALMLEPTELITRPLQEDKEWMLKVMPYKDATGYNSVQWAVDNFSDGLMRLTPAFAVPDMLVHERLWRKADMLPFGIAMMMEYGFMRTPEGHRTALLKAAQIQKTIRETANLMIVYALLDSGHYVSEWSDVRTGAVSVDEFEAAIRAEINQFALIQKDVKGLELLTTTAKGILQRRQVMSAVNYIIPNRAEAFATTHPLMRHPQVTGKPDTLSSPVNAPGQIFTSRPMGGSDDDPLVRYNVRGDFARINDGDKLKAQLSDIGRSIDYATSFASIKIIDSERDEKAQINLEDVVVKSGIARGIDPGVNSRVGGRSDFSGRERNEPTFTAEQIVGRYTDDTIGAYLKRQGHVFFNAIARHKRTHRFFEGLGQDSDDDNGDDNDTLHSSQYDRPKFDGPPPPATAAASGAPDGGGGGGGGDDLPTMADTTARSDSNDADTTDGDISGRVGESAHAKLTNLRERIVSVKKGGKVTMTCSDQVASSLTAENVTKSQATRELKKARIHSARRSDLQAEGVEELYWRQAVLNWANVERSSRNQVFVDALSNISNNDDLRRALLSSPVYVEFANGRGNSSSNGSSYEHRSKRRRGNTGGEVGARPPVALIKHGLMRAPIKRLGEFTLFCVQNDIPCPVQFILARPRIVERMGVMIAAAEGVGFTYAGQPIVTKSPDNLRRAEIHEFVVRFKPIVIKPANLVHLQNVWCDALVRGEGSEILDLTDGNMVNDFRSGRRSADIVPIPVPLNWRPKKTFFDLLGHYNHHRVANSRAGPSHYPQGVADQLAWLLNIEHLAQNHKWDYMTAPTSRQNTIVLQTRQWGYNSRNGKWDDETTNGSHWGRMLAPGSVAARTGHLSNAMMRKFD